MARAKPTLHHVGPGQKVQIKVRSKHFVESCRGFSKKKMRPRPAHDFVLVLVRLLCARVRTDFFRAGLGWALGRPSPQPSLLRISPQIMLYEDPLKPPNEENPTPKARG